MNNAEATEELLTWAAAWGTLAQVQKLIADGADVNERDADGKAAWDLAEGRAEVRKEIERARVLAVELKCATTKKGRKLLGLH